MSIIKQNGNRLVITDAGEKLWIEPWGENALRIRATKMAEMPAEDWALEAPVETGADITIGETGASIKNGKIEALVTKAGKITYGSNVKEVTAQVSEGAVDCGVVYQTDAFSAGLTTVDTATAEMCGQVIYPAAVLAGSAHGEQARAFLDYLMGEEGDAVFSAVGFTPTGAE